MNKVSGLVGSGALLGFGALLIAASAAAQQPEGLLERSKATSGSTDVAAEGFQKVAAEDPESKDGAEASISAGGLFASGNSRSIAITSSGNFRYRGGDNQFTSAAAVNYGRSAQAPGEAMQTTVENYQGKVRYDRFFAERWAAFMSFSARRDRFQQLDLRLNLDPGIAYYFVDADNHQFWTEVGYDLQFDIRRDEAIAAAELAQMMDPDVFIPDKHKTRHSARLFLGYDNKLNEAVSVTTGLEYLQGLAQSGSDTDKSATESWRLNWDVAVTSKVGTNLSIATTFGIKYDNAPVGDVEKTDALTSVNLVYTLL